jgi:carboxypeptidase Taq
MSARTSDQQRHSPEVDLRELKRRLLEIRDFGAAGRLLHWDQATYMPKGGAAARARQSSTLSRLVHEKSVDPELGKLLDRLAPHGEALAFDSDDGSLIRIARRNFEKATKVPAEFVARASGVQSSSYDAWTRARPANDFASMVPFLQQALDLSREYAQFFAPYEHIADPMINDADEGMTATGIQKLFAGLKHELVPLVQAIADQPLVEDRCLKGKFATARQLEFALALAQSIGYDLDRGRLDTTVHPFCAPFSVGDVRITTRVYEDEIGQALFSTLHEAGHGLYEQGVDPALDGTPLAGGSSAGVHESQSRLWENIVGRSRRFWEFHFPKLQERFPDHFVGVSPGDFYRAINRVEPTLIRTDADEVTYNLHIMMRFDLELKLLEGRLEIEDLPDAWTCQMEENLGLTPPDDRDGCLQDVHWYVGGIGGGFQGYTIGNILSSQFFAAAVEAHSEIPDQIARGEFQTLHTWLRENIYQHGSKFTPHELVERATGESMNTIAFVKYLREKYGEIYDLPMT